MWGKFEKKIINQLLRRYVFENEGGGGQFSKLKKL